LDFDVQSALRIAAENLPIPGSAESLADCYAFVIERLRHMFLDQGFPYDIVDAVITSQGSNPAKAAKAVTALSGWVSHPNWNKILPAFARCVRITRPGDEIQPVNVNQDLLEKKAEHDLYQALIVAEESLDTPESVDDFFRVFIPMIPPINTFFDDVLVMVDDPDLRKNRLGLLQRISALAEGAADLSKLEGF
jgi:glycyl-tRNA synthetase